MADRLVAVDDTTFLFPAAVQAAYLGQVQTKLNTAVTAAIAGMPDVKTEVANKVTQSLLDPIYKTGFNVKAFGAKGNGTDDDSAAVQAAVNAAHTAGGGDVYFPPGIYVVNSTITLYIGVTVRGSGKGTTGIGHGGSTFLFDCQSNNTTPTALFQNFGIEDLSIYAQNGFRINNTDTFNGTDHQSDNIMGMRVRGVRFVNPNGAAFQTATNAGSAVVPTASELRAQGVGLMATGCYDVIVENCFFGLLGIGIFFDACDISTIRNSRFEKNSRHIHLTHHATEGARIAIQRNDILTFWRMGGIFADTDSVTIDTNYFEPIFLGISNTVAQILRTEGGDSGLKFLNNSIDCGSSAVPLISISGYHPAIFDNNHVYTDAAGQYHSVEVRHDFSSWDPRFPTPVFWGTNPGFNRPVNVAGPSIDSYVFTSGNIPPGCSGGALGSWPFVQSPVTGRQVLRTDSGDLVVRFILQNTTFRTFRIFYTGRKVTAGGFRRVTYTEGSATAQIVAGGSLGFTATTNVQTFSEVLTLPAGAAATGYFDVAISNREVEYERIQLQPMS